jgi:hypothetical protein
MTMAHPVRENDHFYPARQSFDAMVDWAQKTGPTDHSEVECALEERGRELLRLLYQGWYDKIAAAERREAAKSGPAPKGTRVSARGRQLESMLGRVHPVRLEYRRAGEKKGRLPLDARLNLPATLYSHPLQKRVAGEAQARAWDGVVKQVDEATSAHVPKRQAQQIARDAVKDFDAFYAQRPMNNSLGENTLLAGSSDAKGVRVLPKALREATRKAAEAEKAAAVRGDPMAAKKLRSHDKRMAAVAAVWQQEPLQRTADDIVAEMQRTPASKASKPKLPRPENKRVWASVEKNVSTSVGEMFDEFDRRDPDRVRRATVLVDGEEDQQTAILDHARSHRRSVTIVLDLIHVIHYLWLAGFALCRQKEAAAAAWVAQHLLLLLSVGVTDLVTAIERTTAAQRLTKNARKPVEQALKYFRRNADFMAYPAFLAAGLPIATGVIEGACRHLVQDRLGITGARWDLPGAEAMLKLRGLHSSGDWDNYWRFHEQQEAVRNYPKMPAAT